MIPCDFHSVLVHGVPADDAPDVEIGQTVILYDDTSGEDIEATAVVSTISYGRVFFTNLEYAKLNKEAGRIVSEARMEMDEHG